MIGLTVETRNKALDFALGGDLYVGLLTAKWEGTSPVEPKSGKYARQPIKFGKAADGAKEMVGESILWINAGAAEWPIEGLAVFDAKTGGEVCAVEDINTSVKMDGVFRLNSMRVSLQ